VQFELSCSPLRCHREYGDKMCLLCLMKYKRTMQGWKQDAFDVLDGRCCVLGQCNWHGAVCGIDLNAWIIHLSALQGVCQPRHCAVAREFVGGGGPHIM
jgi:hypothetical protein